MSQVYEGSEGENAVVAEDDQNGGMKSFVGKMKDKAKLPTLKNKMRKLKNKVPFGKNKNNGSDGTDDDRHSQEDNHEDDSGSGGEENESDNDDTKQQGTAAARTSDDVGFHPGSLPSEPHAVHDHLKKLPLDPTEEQSSTTREENNGNNLQAVDPESKSAAANNNNAGGGGGGGFTGLKNTVIGTAAAAAGAVGSKIGYYSGSDENAQETKKSSSAASSTAGAGTRPAGKTYTQQATDTVVGMKNSVAASLGLDKPSDPNAPSFLDKTKGYMTTTSDAAKGFTTGATDRAYNSRDRVLTATAPGDEHKALAQQVTESLSKLPATLKESVFGTSSASSTVDSSANDKTPGKDEKPAAHAPQGLVSGITDAVSSLFSKKGDTGSSAAVNDHPPPFPAHLDQ
ncbi:hypothetical protein BDL97_02G080700 [Sphagnum fallax]|nr:hypothetical protein BDL97_02G080700 [Sphagnum fallax]